MTQNAIPAEKLEKFTEMQAKLKSKEAEVARLSARLDMEKKNFIKLKTTILERTGCSSLQEVSGWLEEHKALAEKDADNFIAAVETFVKKVDDIQAKLAQVQ